LMGWGWGSANCFTEIIRPLFWGMVTTPSV